MANVQDSAAVTSRPQRVALSQATGRSASQARTSGVGLSSMYRLRDALLPHHTALAPSRHVWEIILHPAKQVGIP